MQAQASGVGLYLHIPFCVRKCPYCAFYSEPVTQHNPEPVIDAMFMELERCAIVEPVETIYIGGGSPTCLPPRLLVETVVSLQSQFKGVKEFTIECNPAQAGLPLLEDLHALGVNRLSIGAQSFDDLELKVLGRIHSASQIDQAVTTAKAAGFANISLDLIFASPASTMAIWRASLERAIALDVTHISAYSLTVEKNTPYERDICSGRLSLPDEVTERQMHAVARDALTNAGFRQYEISNFAKPGFECLHNLRYWRNLPVIGIGPSAAGWYRGQRTANVADLDNYVRTIETGAMPCEQQHSPTPEEAARQTAVLNLRMTDGLDLAAFAQRTGFNALELFADAIAAHTRNGLLERTATHLKLTEKGLSFADTVACDFA